MAGRISAGRPSPIRDFPPNLVYELGLGATSRMTIADTVYEKLKAASPEVAREVLDFLEFLEAKSKEKPTRPGRSWDEFMGSLKDSKVFEGDPADIQRKLREEWDREWDK